MKRRPIARVWLRVSDRKQDEQQQLGPCVRRIAYGDRGEPWDFDEATGIYRAHAVAGDDLEHPLRARVFDDAAAGKFDRLVVWELSRWTRGGILVVLQDQQRLAKACASLVSVREDWLDVPIMVAMQAWQDAQKLDVVRDGTQRALEERRKLIARDGGFWRRPRTKSEQPVWVTKFGRPPALSDAAKARALELHGQGASTGKIARELKVARTTVWDFLSGKGLVGVSKKGGAPGGRTTA